MAEQTWQYIGGIKKWIDENVDVSPEQALLVRVLKVQEELGEAAQALIGEMGTNPRKGQSHSREDVLKELSDVVLTGMVALATASEDPEAFFARHLAAVAERCGVTV
jgi:NTP pyrophosphatase (non-canonical NTP hydrolase)